MLPAAATEAFYGNTERASELIGMGMTVGGGIGGAFKVGGFIGRKAKEIAPDATLSAIHKVTGVPKKAISYFNNNPGLRHKIKPLDDILPGIDDATMAHKADLSMAKENQKLATANLDEARRTTEKEMKAQSKEVHPLMAEEMEKDLGIAQKKFNEISEAAEENLAANIPGKTVDASTVVAKMDEHIADFKGLHGVEDRATLSKLKQLRKSLTKDGMLTGMGARKLIKSMRRDVEYKGAFTPRDKTYERLVKGYAADTRNILRDTPGAEDFSRAMDFLAPKLEALGAFKKSMSSESSRLNMASIMSEPMLTGVKHEKRKAFTEFMEEIGVAEKYTEMGVDQATAHQYLSDFKTRGKSKDQATRDQFDSDRFENLSFDKAQADSVALDLSVADKAMGPAIGGAKSLTPDKMAKIFMGDDDQAKRALDSFLERAGIDKDTVEASIMSHEFSKGKNSGFRYINPRVVLGTMMGGWKGAVTSLAVDTLGGPILREGMLAKQLLAEKLGPTLGAISTRVKGITKAIDGSVPKLGAKPGDRLRKLQLSTYRASIDDVPKDERKNIGITDKKPTAENINDVEFQQNMWRALTNKYSQYEADPEKLMETIAFKTSVVADDPDLAGPLAEHLMRATGYLAQEIPKDPTTPGPFTAPEDRWVPSDMELDIFSQKVMAVQDPLSAVDAIADGSITMDMMSAVAATAPVVMGMMQQQVIGAIAKDPTKYDYDKKISIGYLLDMPLETTATPKAYSFFQQTFAVVDEQGNIPQGGRGGFAPRLGQKSADIHMSKSTKLSNDVYT